MDPNITSAVPIRFSIVVATFNPGSVLLRCLESVISQTYRHVELIIIDGGSTDGSMDLIHAYSNAVKYWESSPDRGIAHAWNKGVSCATGDWILFLGADDYLWGRDSLEQMASWLGRMAFNCKIVYGCVVGVDGHEKQLGILSSEWNRKRFVYGEMYFSHQGVFHHRSLFSQYGMFDESYRFALDYELMLRYLVTHNAFYVRGVIVSGMQLGGMSNVAGNAVKTLKEFARARRKNHVRHDSLSYYRALIGAYGKLYLVKLFGPQWAARCIGLKKAIF